MSSPRTLYLVDHGQLFGVYLRRVLRPLGVDVECFGSAEEFLIELPSRMHRPACVLIDFNLPRMDGLELLGVLGSLQAPFVCMLWTATPGSPKELAGEAVRRGAFDVLSKAVDHRFLRQRIEEALAAAHCGVKDVVGVA